MFNAAVMRSNKPTFLQIPLHAHTKQREHGLHSLQHLQLSQHTCTLYKKCDKHRPIIKHNMQVMCRQHWKRIEQKHHITQYTHYYHKTHKQHNEHKQHSMQITHNMQYTQNLHCTHISHTECVMRRCQPVCRTSILSSTMVDSDAKLLFIN